MNDRINNCKISCTLTCTPHSEKRYPNYLFFEATQNWVEFRKFKRKFNCIVVVKTKKLKELVSTLTEGDSVVVEGFLYSRYKGKFMQTYIEAVDINKI